MDSYSQRILRDWQKRLRGFSMVVSNEDVKELVVEVPKGHKHIRTTIVFMNGAEFTFQEATVANLVRAYITVKTHPITNKITLRGGKLARRKDGYAEWQLLELENNKQ
jgi:hypothetical protein